MSNIISDLTISITPNGKPEWSGNIKGAIFDPTSKFITYTAPIGAVNGGYQFISLDLWIDAWTCKNEDSFSLSGTTYSARPLITNCDPTIICPCASLIDEFIAAEDNVNTYGVGYTEIYQETLEGVLSELFIGTGWKVVLGSDLIKSFPVVTEISPVIVLNGNKLEQLTQLLGMFTPDNLWDQSLSFFLNIFTLEILIVPPEASEDPEELVFFTVDMDLVKPIDFNVRKEDISEKPLNIILQEYESALYRHESHFEASKYNEESYTFNTSTSIEEADDDETDIRASISGERANIGTLTLWDQHNVVIDESRFGSVEASYGSSLVPSATYNISWSENKTTDVTVLTLYEYILGPPYGSMTSQGTVFSNGDVKNEDNLCFPLSLPGTRQQMSRDIAPIKITKLHYPKVLASTDGIRVSKKTSTTVESLKVIGNAPEDGQDYVAGDTESEQVITTEVVESLAYDEDGYLVTNRSKKTVTKDTGEVTITNTTIVFTPISTDFYAQMTYSMQSEYDALGALIDSSVTDISIQTVSGEQTGPQPISAYASVENNTFLREMEFESDSATDVYAQGTTYTGVNNLTLEEAEKYLTTYYLLGPNSAFYVSFESEFIDPRNVLGGFVKLIGSNAHRSVMMDMNGVVIPLYSTGIIGDDKLYRITGIAFQWDGEKPPTTAIALCRME